MKTGRNAGRAITLMAVVWPALVIAQPVDAPPFGFDPQTWAQLPPATRAILSADAKTHDSAMNSEEKAAALREDTRRAAVAAVKTLLKDPISAQFRGIKRTSPFHYCGWVNAKNSYGGYTGFAQFAASDKGTVILPPNLSDPSLCQ